MADLDKQQGGDVAGVVHGVARFTEMAHQVGGHATEKTSLKTHGGKIFKPFQNKQRGEREYAFYEHVFNSQCANPVLERLRPLIPGYHGMVIVSSSRDAAATLVDTSGTAGSESCDRKHLVMDDLTWGRRWPCIMDVKVGTQSYEHNASAEKIAYEKQKFPLQEIVGFRIQGIKVLDPAQQQYVEFDKYFGRKVQSPIALVPAFQQYLRAHEHDARKVVALLEAFLARLKQLEAWFTEQQELEFIASSLLFLYNGEVDEHAVAAAADPSAALTHALAADIRLIDFAHVTHRPRDALQLDEGVLLGIRTVARCFRELLALSKQQLQHQE